MPRYAEEEVRAISRIVLFKSPGFLASHGRPYGIHSAALKQLATVLASLLLAAAAFAQTAALPAMSLKVGDVAPDFTLKDQNGKEISLHDYKGQKNVVVAFLVFAFSGG